MAQQQTKLNRWPAIQSELRPPLMSQYQVQNVFYCDWVPVSKQLKAFYLETL